MKSNVHQTEEHSQHNIHNILGFNVPQTEF